jgi:putative peptidoglycan lipid II flippase
VSSEYPGAISWLYGADRLYQLPLGVVGIAVGLVLLPELSKRLQTNDAAGSKQALNKGTEIALALTLPAAVALMVIPAPLASVLYEYGATNRDDIMAIAMATAIYGLGLPAFILQKLLQPLFFAREDTKTPFRLAVWSMIINAVLALGLMPWMGWIAAAVATTVSSWAMVVLLVLSARRFGDVVRLTPQVRVRIVKMCVAAGIMGAVLWVISTQTMGYTTTVPARILGTIGLIALGALVYGASGRALGAFDLQDLKSSLRRRR